jgi:hypothetical protein
MGCGPEGNNGKVRLDNLSAGDVGVAAALDTGNQENPSSGLKNTACDRHRDPRIHLGFSEKGSVGYIE